MSKRGRRWIGDAEEHFSDGVDRSGRVEYQLDGLWLNGRDLTEAEATEAMRAMGATPLTATTPVVRRARLPWSPPPPPRALDSCCADAAEEADRMGAAAMVVKLAAARLWRHVTLEQLAEAAGVTLDDVAEARRRLRRGEQL